MMECAGSTITMIKTWFTLIEGLQRFQSFLNSGKSLGHSLGRPKLRVLFKVCHHNCRFAFKLTLNSNFFQCPMFFWGSPFWGRELWGSFWSSFDNKAETWEVWVFWHYSVNADQILVAPNNNRIALPPRLFRVVFAYNLASTVLEKNAWLYVRRTKNYPFGRTDCRDLLHIEAFKPKGLTGLMRIVCGKSWRRLTVREGYSNWGETPRVFFELNRFQLDVFYHKFEFTLGRPLEIFRIRWSLHPPKSQFLKNVLRPEKSIFVKQVRKLTTLPFKHLPGLLFNLGRIFSSNQNVVPPYV